MTFQGSGSIDTGSVSGGGGGGGGRIALGGGAGLLITIVALFFVGWLSVSFMSTGNATLQLESEPQMRGRVMALWSVAFMGSTPIGGPIVGAIIETFGARVGLAVGAVACLAAGSLAFLAARRSGTAS